MFIHDKMVPQWAEDLKAVRKIALCQQKELNSNLIFGRSKGVEYLDNSKIYNVENMKYEDRGSSANW